MCQLQRNEIISVGWRATSNRNKNNNENRPTMEVEDHNVQAKLCPLGSDHGLPVHQKRVNRPVVISVQQIQIVQTKQEQNTWLIK